VSPDQGPNQNASSLTESKVAGVQSHCGRRSPCAGADV